MDNSNNEKELSAELKLKLLQAETSLANDAIQKSKIIKSGISGAVIFGIFPFFGVFLMNIWQLISSILIFSIAGGLLFSLATYCRNYKK